MIWDRIFKGNKKIPILICAFLVPFVLMQIFWAICGVYPFGRYSILTGDMDLEFVNFYSYFINIFSSKNDLSYMFAKTLGGDYPGLAAFQLHDPLLFVLFFFKGKNIALGIELVFTLQVSIAGLSAGILLNNRYKCSWMSLLFSTAYSFCAFFFGYLVLTIYFGALAILPLVIYLFLSFLDDRRYLIPYILVTAYYIFVNYHMGFMLVIFLILLYLSRVIADTGYLSGLKDFIISGITVLLLDGFFLVRTGLSLLGEKTVKTADYGFYRRFPMNQLFAALLSGTAKNDLKPLIYCSVAAVFFALVFFFGPGFSVREKIADIFLLASILISMWINLFDAVWHGFNNPEGFYWRYAYYISIIIIVLGYRGFIRLHDDKDSSGVKMRQAIFAFAVICAYIVWLIISKNTYLDKTGYIINVLLITVIFLVTVVMIMRPRFLGACMTVLTVLTIFDLLYSSRTAYLSLNSDKGKLPLMSDFMEAYEDINAPVSYVKSVDDGFYRLEKDFDRAVNDPAMFDYIGLSHDSSCEKDEIIDWLINFGFCRTVYYTYYNGGNTSFVDSLFGVKYYLSRFDTIVKPYIHLPYEGRYHVYRNELALPMAFNAPDGLKDLSAGEGNTFELQNRIASYWGLKDDIYKKAGYKIVTDGYTEDGPGHFVKEREDGEVVYEISIDSENPLYIYFAAPGRQSCGVKITDGSKDADDAEYEPYFTENHWNIISAGQYKPGDIVRVGMKTFEDSMTISEACFYYEDTDALNEWNELAKELNTGVSEVTELSSSHLIFNTVVQKDSDIIMTIPYDRAWDIKCDGKKVKQEKAVDVLMDIPVPAGSHKIEMRYIPKGTVPGAMLSFTGLAVFIWYCTVTLRREGKDKEDPGGEQSL
ncbi:MAG: YfhO family protein [Lachnospiraceae bacterium]|nr:YfhO family protein [Lachnospiraceae bacterium]